MNLHRLTPRPSMGWNGDDSFGCFVNEKRVAGTARRPGRLRQYHRITDLWNRRDLGDLRQPLRLVLPPDEVLFVRYQS